MSKVSRTCNGVMTVDSDVADSLEYNGTYLPNVDKVTFNLKTTERIPVKDENGKIKQEVAKGKDGVELKDRNGNLIMKNVYETKTLKNPVLTTRVDFDDGTHVIVQNSEHDLVETEEVEVVKGSGVKTVVATSSSKERGVSYAILKRATGKIDSKNGVDGNGLGRILNEIVSEGYDQQFEAAKSKYTKAQKKAAYTERIRQQKAKPAKKRYSYNELAQLAGPILENLVKKVQEDPDFLKKIIGA